MIDKVKLTLICKYCSHKMELQLRSLAKKMEIYCLNCSKLGAYTIKRDSHES